MYWLRNWTKTENYQAKEQGLDPFMPFPYKPYRDRPIDLDALPFPHRFTKDDPPDYLDVVAGYWMTCRDLNVPKTREMLTSWLMVGLITWHCQFNEAIGWIAQSEKDEKAQGLIKYANILYDNQPEWMKKRFPLKRGESGTMHRIDWANSSWFRGVPQGERQLASDHPHGYFSDETAHQAGAEGSVNIASPAVRQMVKVSSAAPSWFGNECQAVGA